VRVNFLRKADVIVRSRHAPSIDSQGIDLCVIPHGSDWTLPHIHKGQWQRFLRVHAGDLRSIGGGVQSYTRGVWDLGDNVRYLYFMARRNDQ